MKSNNLTALDEKYIICSTKNLLNYQYFDHEVMFDLAEAGCVLAVADIIKHGYILGSNSVRMVRALEQRDIGTLTADEAYTLFLKKSLVDEPDSYAQIAQIEQQLVDLQKSIWDKMKNDLAIEKLTKQLNSYNATQYLKRAVLMYEQDAKQGNAFACEQLLSLNFEHKYFCKFSDSTLDKLNLAIQVEYNHNNDNLLCKFVYAKNAFLSGKTTEQNLQGKNILNEIVESHQERVM